MSKVLRMQTLGNIFIRAARSYICSILRIRVVNVPTNVLHNIVLDLSAYAKFLRVHFFPRRIQYVNTDRHTRSLACVVVGRWYCVCVCMHKYAHLWSKKKRVRKM